MTYKFKGLRYPSFYIKDYQRAIDFYTAVLGPPKNDVERINGWYIGDSWLTLFPAEDMGHDAEANPRNAEFAIEVSEPEEVDRLYEAMITAGATKCMEPEDTWMYEEMRYCCVDDPVSIRIDIFCLIPPKN